MAQHRVVQALRVYGRVASLVLLFLGITVLLYHLLPAPLVEPDNPPAKTKVGAAGTRSSSDNAQQSVLFPLSTTSSLQQVASSPSTPLVIATPFLSPVVSTSSSTSTFSSPSTVVTLPAVSPSNSPLPSRGPPRLERFQASIVVPLLSLNPNITSNVCRLLAFLNTTYHLSSPSSTTTLSPAAGTSSSLVPSSSPAQVMAMSPVEVLLVVDPAQVPLAAAADQPSSAHETSPYPSLGLPQQWELYHFKRMLREFQNELRRRDLTYFRLLVLEPSSSSTAGDSTAGQTCRESGGRAFGAACNLGAARARGQWLFFLSAETYMEEGWFEEQLRALSALQTAQQQQQTTRTNRNRNRGGKVLHEEGGLGLIGCKILDGRTAERAHSAGLDVALSRRKVTPCHGGVGGLPSTAAAVASSTIMPTSARSAAPVLEPNEAKTLEEWRETLSKQGQDELHVMMLGLAASASAKPPEQTKQPVAKAVVQQQLVTVDEKQLHDVVFPYRRLEGVARTDPRFAEEAEIIAPSSLCFIADKRIFLSSDDDDSSSSSSSSFAFGRDLPTPLLQVLELSLRLRTDSGRRSIYLPTHKGVVLSNRPTEAAWNAEDTTAWEDHGLCSSTLRTQALPASSPSQQPQSLLSYYAYGGATRGTSADTSSPNAMPLFPHQLSAPELAFVQQRWASELDRTVDSRRQTDVELVWDSYGGCTGWGLEAVRFVTALEPLVGKVSVVADKNSYCGGLPRNVVQSLRRARSLLDDSTVSPGMWHNESVQVWVSHKPPLSYPTFPYLGSVIISRQPDYIIGRSMTETTAIPAGWATNAERVDEIWVPSSFLLESFVNGGVPRDKLVVLPIPIDTEFYSPLSSSSLFSSSSSSSSSLSSSSLSLRPLSLPNRGSFNFLSVFKWEQRKGWDILLEAYFTEFQPEENTTLYLQTYLQGAQGREKSTFEWKVAEHAEYVIEAVPALAGRLPDSLPRVEILCEELPEQNMPRLYAAADAFVLPTKGEGFGMPIMEAMAMGLPVIATNWSGQVDFMNERNAYPIRVEAMVNVATDRVASDWGQLLQSSPFAGKWARPSVAHLRQLMRHVFTNREEAKQKGQVARADIVAHYSQEKVAGQVVERLKGIERVVRDRRKRHA